MKEIVNPDIRFVTKEDAAIFWAIILSELDVRIGEEISKNLTDSQLKEYDDLIQRGNGEGGLWLERNLPEYKQIVSNKKIEMKREIDAYKSII